MMPHIGWLTDLTNWIVVIIKSLMPFIFAFFTDLLELVVSAGVDSAIFIIYIVPTPDFLSGVSICGILSNGGSTVGWAISTMQVPAGMALISAAFAFRMARKVFTVFQW
jgi:hypothetical protein